MRRKVESFSHRAIKHSLQLNVHGFVIWKRNSIHSRNWFKTTKYQKCSQFTVITAPTLPFCGIFHYIKHLPIVCWRFQKCPLSVLERCTSYREYIYSKMTEKRQGPTPGVRSLRVECIFWSYSSNMLLQLLSLYAAFNFFIYYYLFNSCPTCVTNF